MFLTRFLINRTRPATQKMLGSPYCLHAAVAGSFPTEEPSHKASIRPLWRLDIEPTGSAWLYIVSQTEPSLVGLDEQIGFPDQPPTWQTRHYDPFLNSLNEGQLWSFRLVANPVRAVRKQPRSSDERGKRLGHTTATQQLAWLIGQAAYPPDSDSEIRKQFPPPVKSKAASNGFAIPIDESDCPRVMVSNRHTHQLQKRHTKDRITISTVRFDGVLRVTDAELLRTALTRGIGHAKAFGCGLLTLAPLIQ